MWEFSKSAFFIMIIPLIFLYFLALIDEITTGELVRYLLRNYVDYLLATYFYFAGVHLTYKLVLWRKANISPLFTESLLRKFFPQICTTEDNKYSGANEAESGTNEEHLEKDKHLE